MAALPNKRGLADATLAPTPASEKRRNALRFVVLEGPESDEPVAITR